MGWTRGMGLALALLAAGCSSAPAPACRCPAPVHYGDAMLKKIQQAREALPKGSVLQQVLIDYENERDDLRFCRGTEPAD